MHERDEGTVDSKVASPTTYFEEPRDVLTAQGLTKEDKIRVLESWLQDAKRLAESEAENMAGGEPNREREIALALQELRD